MDGARSAAEDALAEMNSRGVPLSELTALKLSSACKKRGGESDLALLDQLLQHSVEKHAKGRTVSTGEQRRQARYEGRRRSKRFGEANTM